MKYIGKSDTGGAMYSIKNKSDQLFYVKTNGYGDMEADSIKDAQQFAKQMMKIQGCTHVWIEDGLSRRKLDDWRKMDKDGIDDENGKWGKRR